MAFDYNRQKLESILRLAGYEVSVSDPISGTKRYRGEPITIAIDERGGATFTRRRILDDHSSWRALRGGRFYDVTTERHEVTTIRGSLVRSTDLAGALPELERLLDQRP